MNYQTTPPQLNLRKQPKVSRKIIIAVLPQGYKSRKNKRRNLGMVES
jgi:hypothetical protein